MWRFLYLLTVKAKLSIPQYPLKINHQIVKTQKNPSLHTLKKCDAACIILCGTYNAYRKVGLEPRTRQQWISKP